MDFASFCFRVESLRPRLAVSHIWSDIDALDRSRFNDNVIHLAKQWGVRRRAWKRATGHDYLAVSRARDASMGFLMQGACHMQRASGPVRVNLTIESHTRATC